MGTYYAKVGYVINGYTEYSVKAASEDAARAILERKLEDNCNLDPEELVTCEDEWMGEQQTTRFYARHTSGVLEEIEEIPL